MGEGWVWRGLEEAVEPGLGEVAGQWEDGVWGEEVEEGAG